MNYHVRDLIDLQELQVLMEGLNRVTGLTNALLDTDGNVLIAAGWQKACADFHRVKPKSCERCHQSDRFILESAQEGGYIGYECLNGLFDYAVPVIVAEKHVATMFIGQLLHEQPDMERFANQAREHAYEQNEYLAVIRQVKVVPREQMDDIMHFMARLAESLGKCGLEKLKQLEANAALDSIVQERTAELVKTIDLLTREVTAREEAERDLRESKEELQRLAASRERAKEDERKRIAREIHDELGQSLLALRIDVAMLQARTGITHPHLHRKCTDALRSIDATVKSVRNIINNLRPAVLDLSLGAAVEWQVKEFERRSGIRCSLELGGEYPLLPEERATAVFRILQESLTNIHRHADARNASVRIDTEGNCLLMRIADDGIGIDPAFRNKKNAFGLLGIQERVEMMGGDLHIGSSEEGGAEITVSIPYAVDEM